MTATLETIVPPATRVITKSLVTLTIPESRQIVSINYISPVEQLLFDTFSNFHCATASRDLNPFQSAVIQDRLLQALEANCAAQTTTARITEILDHARTFGRLSASEYPINGRSNLDSRLEINQQPVPPQTDHQSLRQRVFTSLKRFVATGSFARFQPPAPPSYSLSYPINIVPPQNSPLHQIYNHLTINLSPPSPS